MQFHTQQFDDQLLNCRTSRYATARRLDASDPLRRFREQFIFPQNRSEAEVYLCGNSLGLMPTRAAARVLEFLQLWASEGVYGHFPTEKALELPGRWGKLALALKAALLQFRSDGSPEREAKVLRAMIPAFSSSRRSAWLPYHENLLDALAEVVGSNREGQGPVETIPTATLSANLNILLQAFLNRLPEGSKILTIADDFPSDAYALVSQVRLAGIHEDCIEWVTLDELYPRLRALGSDCGMLVLPAVHFRTGAVLDIQGITRQAREHCGEGVKVGFDLAHASGNCFDLRMHDWGVDFAVGCGYKYLNAGAGHGGFLFLHERWCLDSDFVHAAGWWGNDPKSRFKMTREFVPCLTAERLQLSNPPLLSLACLWGSLEVLMDAGLAEARIKGRLLSDFLYRCLSDSHYCGGAYQIITPEEPAQRGLQVSIRLVGESSQVGAGTLVQQLAERGVIVDDRPPDILRFAAHPLYNKFEDVVAGVGALEGILAGILIK